MTVPQVEPGSQALAGFVGRHLRRNFAALSLDFGFFGLGMTFYSVSTILPAFAEHLGASNLVIGAIPSIATVGVTLPALFLANHAERLPYKLRFILGYTVWERLPLLLLAGAAYFFAERSPGLILALMLVCLSVMWGTGGALMPAFMDMIGKVIPTNYRGRLFAASGTFAGVLGLAGALLSGHYLQAYPFPTDYVLCFVTGFLFLAGSFVAVSFTLEPVVPTGKAHVDQATYFRRLPEILARDRDFTAYLVSRSVGMIGATGYGFYTVFALRSLGAPEWQVANFTFVLLAGQAVANLACGYVGDHVGHKPVLLAGGVASVLANAVALASGRVGHVYLAFVLMAVALASLQVSGLNIALEFAPPADRPTYVGLSSTLTAPLALVAPLAGGLLADRIGYSVVFAVSAAAGVLSAGILAARVSDPRHGR